MVPPAPGLFSTMNCCPSATMSRGAMKRAMRSLPPPGAKATMILTGRTGYVCPEANPANRTSKSASKRISKRSCLEACRNARRFQIELVRHRPLHHGPREEAGIVAGVQARRVGEGELAEVLRAHEAPLDHLERFGHHVLEVGHVEV